MYSFAYTVYTSSHIYATRSICERVEELPSPSNLRKIYKRAPFNHVKVVADHVANSKDGKRSFDPSDRWVSTNSRLLNAVAERR